VSTDNLKNASENEIRKMLAELKNAKAAAPAPLPPPGDRGAMCYDPPMPPKYFEFVCPIDGDKTLYPYMEGVNAKEVSQMPKSAENLNKLAKGKNITFTVDITQFCKKHYPDLKTRQPILIVTYKDGRVIKNPVDTNQFYLLEAFFNEKNNRGEIKNGLPEIAKLLGQDINDL